MANRTKRTTYITKARAKRHRFADKFNAAGNESQLLNALCTNYTAAYFCDLMNDYIEPIKQKSFSHSAKSENSRKNLNSYSEWINYAYENIIIKETSPDYLELFDAGNLMERLRKKDSFVYSHKTHPNSVGMEYFEISAIRLCSDKHSFNIILGYRPVDDIIIEEMRLREELQKALFAAEKANRAKTDFLRRMSHDIRTPLNGLIGLLNIDEAHFDNRELVRANHDKMLISANHLLSLINDVLQMSKLEDGTTQLAHEAVSLIDLTREIVTIVIDRAVEAGIQWNYERGKTLIPYPYIYCSPLHIRQIFLNIYGNCIKYNRPGGKITTIVQAYSDNAKNICHYRWIITDTGVGMSEEFLKHIFEPFAQEKSDARSVYQGTGLGMAIVKGLIEQMGGSISVTSEVGVGSEFIIDIPFEIAPAPEETTSDLSQQNNDISGLHLLLAEDNELNAEIAEVLLGDKGAEVTTVSDGRQALAMFETNPPGTFDAILMDMMMPVMDGITATKKIRALGRPDAKTIPIIAMTANAFYEDAESCIAAGMNAHLSKPLQIERVVSTISQYCNTDKN